MASKLITWVPTGSRPDQANRTSRFQSGLVSAVVIAWTTPATFTWTQFAGEPSRLR